MTARNYPLVPTTFHRQVLAVLATAKIMQGSELQYGGLLIEDVRNRLPCLPSSRERAGVALDALVEAGYVTLTSGQSAFRCYTITALGMRVVLGVLG